MAELKIVIADLDACVAAVFWGGARGTPTAQDASTRPVQPSVSTQRISTTTIGSICWSSTFTMERLATRTPPRPSISAGLKDSGRVGQKSFRLSVAISPQSPTSTATGCSTLQSETTRRAPATAPGSPLSIGILPRASTRGVGPICSPTAELRQRRTRLEQGWVARAGDGLPQAAGRQP